MAQLSEEEVFGACVARACNVKRASQQLCCMLGRVKRAIHRRSLAGHAAREERIFQERKCRLIAELRVLEIVQ